MFPVYIAADQFQSFGRSDVPPRRRDKLLREQLSSTLRNETRNVNCPDGRLPNFVPALRRDKFVRWLRFIFIHFGMRIK